jgi:trk system potassium uptake protein
VDTASAPSSAACHDSYAFKYRPAFTGWPRRLSRGPAPAGFNTRSGTIRRTGQQEGHIVHVVIMGCGRVGSELAARLEGRGHTVAVIDKREIAFRMLRFDFKGQKIHGYGFDEDVLRQAGIERAGAFAAVSNGDNSNIVAARLAREKFEVPTVVARIYDPRRAEIYQRLGIPTVATVKWTTDQVMRFLIPDEIASDWKDPSEGISLVVLVLPGSWAGWTGEQLESSGHRRVVAVNRIGRARIPTANMILQEGDQLYLAVDEEGLDELRPMVIAAHRRQDAEQRAGQEVRS